MEGNMVGKEAERIYCTIMRGGTSKGIFLKENDLPQDPNIRDKVILAIFGSPDSRQIDGLGGAEVLTSKLALIGAPSRPDADVDYSFGQVDINNPKIYYDGLCGNISSAVGPYAIEEGFVKAVEPVTRVRVHSKNTNQIFYIEVPVVDGKPGITGDYRIEGVPGSGAKLDIDMSGTVGSRTGKLLPTGNVVDSVHVDGIGNLDVSITDLANPAIYVKAADLNLRGNETPAELDNKPGLMELIQKIRVACADITHIDGWKPENPIPYVMIASEPRDYKDYASGEVIRGEDINFVARMIFLGKAHKTFPGSGSCGIGVTALIPGTVVNQIAKFRSAENVVRLGHPCGIVEVGAEIGEENGKITVKRATYGRTARRLMDGYVYVPNHVFE
jgi:2-methylaconitate cis-trans-isomerase PrpF